MRYRLLFLLNVLLSSLFAQDVLVKHVEKQYFELVYGEELCENDPGMNVVEHEISFRYPQFKMQDVELESTLNTLIDEKVKSCHPYNHNTNIDLEDSREEDNTCYNEYPYRTALNYKLYETNHQFISCDFIYTDEACCGGHGSRVETIPFTFDTAKQSEVFLKDIAENEQALLDSLNKLLALEFLSRNVDVSEVFHISSLGIPFSIHDESIHLLVLYPAQHDQVPFAFCELSLDLEAYKHLLAL